MANSITHTRKDKIYFEPLNFMLFRAECSIKKISRSKRINELLTKEYQHYSPAEKQSLREFFDRNLKQKK